MRCSLAGLFLLHPVQTESVSYIASRSETLSVFFVLAAFVVFLYRRTEDIAVPRVVCILALFAAAALSKEHTVVLPVIFLLTDYYWNFEFAPSRIWRNWKLYVPIALGAGYASLKIMAILRRNPTAGFGMRDLRWPQYFLTECRVIWDYIRLFVFPAGQNLDPDIAISRTILSHGAIFALAGLLIVTVLAWIYRRRFPLASYGWFVWLILLGPTSSFMPIRDPMAERRMYLPFIGLLFITVEFLRRWKVSRNVLVAALALVLLIESGLTYQRNRAMGQCSRASGKTPSRSLLKNIALDSNWRAPNTTWAAAAMRWNSIRSSPKCSVHDTICSWTGRWPTTAQATRSRPSKNSRRPRSCGPTRTLIRRLAWNTARSASIPRH